LSLVFLDTSAYSAFKRNHPQLRYRIQEASQIRLNPVVLGELHAGFLHGTRLKENLADLAHFLESPRVGVIPVDEVTSAHYAALFDPLRRAGTPIPTNDIWIAAGARQCRSVLLTTDPHFRLVTQVEVEIFEPFPKKTEE